MPNSIGFYKGIFLHVIPARIIVLWIKQLTLLPIKMFRLPWLNEKNYPRGCSPIHVRLCTLNFFEIENK